MSSTTHRSLLVKRDLWTRFVEGTVHLAETLCPALERMLSWDVKDCDLISLEAEIEERDAEDTILPPVRHCVRDIHEEMGDFLPHAATAA